MARDPDSTSMPTPAALSRDWSRPKFLRMHKIFASVVHQPLSYPRISDVAAPAIAAAYSLGRTGCWAVGDDYGRPFNGLGSVSFPHGAPPSTVANMTDLFHIPAPPGASPNQVLSVYPTQLYEVALGFVMFLVLWRL